MTLDLAQLSGSLQDVAARGTGRVRALSGLAIHAELADARVGELVQIERRAAPPLLAEVVGFDARGVMLLPLGEPHGLSPTDTLRTLHEELSVPFGDALLGRVVDSLGHPMDQGPTLDCARIPVLRAPPPALERRRIERVFSLGVRALDAFVTVGEGQRLGLFAGSGVGKSTLLGQIAAHADADVFVVALVGERGREVNDFLHDHLGEAGRARGVLVCETSDAPALRRMKCALTATAIAEGFRDQGKRVLLLMDSLTRFARAAREVYLSIGETPVRRGYPPSVLSLLPQLIERAGNAARGSITAFYTVLGEGDDLDDPLADEARGLLDGHVVLSRRYAARGHYPAIDLAQSLSRLQSRLIDDEHRRLASLVRAHLAVYEEKRDLVLLSGHKPGQDERLDAALACIERIHAFLQQREDERSSWEQTLASLHALT